MKVDPNSFAFGLEAEYLLVDDKSFVPLSYRELTFAKLNEALESIPLGGLPPMDGLELEPPHRKLMPYAVEGFGVVDTDFKPHDMLPKGIEIRTPIAASIEDCLLHLKTLHARLQTALATCGYKATAISHHPVEFQFEGPQNKRRHDYWQWAMEVMNTYGPDINVSLPAALTEKLDLKELDAKTNYYAPAMTAFSVASPFRAGEPWRVRGKIGKSLRTYRRSVIAPAIEVHLAESGRLEFKTFEMTTSTQDFHCFFLLWLELLLDPQLRGRASRQSRVYDLGAVARFGLEAESVEERAQELLTRAPVVLGDYGFDTRPLETMRSRLAAKRTPADEILELYQREGSLAAVLRERSVLS